MQNEVESNKRKVESNKAYNDYARFIAKMIEKYQTVINKK